MKKIAAAVALMGLSATALATDGYFAPGYGMTAKGASMLLLRDGTRIFFEVELPPSPYAIYLSRTERRPLTQVWTASLRQRLPAVPVPLLQPDPDVILDLQAAVGACFALVGYERLLDYADPPPPPPLEEEDAAWLDDLLHGAGLR